MRPDVRPIAETRPRDLWIAIGIALVLHGFAAVAGLKWVAAALERPSAGASATTINLAAFSAAPQTAEPAPARARNAKVEPPKPEPAPVRRAAPREPEPEEAQAEETPPPPPPRHRARQASRAKAPPRPASDRKRWRRIILPPSRPGWRATGNIRAWRGVSGSKARAGCAFMWRATEA